ncbi:hypothetical protein Tco_0545895 [Tanacetum coccineum]
MFANMRLSFQGNHMPLLATMLPPAQAAIAGESSGEDAPSNPQTVPATITEPDSRPLQLHPKGTRTRAAWCGWGRDAVEWVAEVVGKLVKKVKLLENKLKGRKRRFVMTDSDKEEDVEQDVDPLIKLAKAATTAAAASAIPTGGSHEAKIPPSSSVPTDEFAGGSDVPVGTTTGPSADSSNKGKSPLMEEDHPVRERTFRQREEDRLGEEAARRMYEEE